MKVLVGHQYCWSFTTLVSLCFQETLSSNTQPCYLNFMFSLRCLPWCSQVLGVRYLIDTSAGDEYPRISCSLHFDQLWLFKMVSEKFIKKGKIRDWERVSGLRESTRFLGLSTVPPSHTWGLFWSVLLFCVAQVWKEVSVFFCPLGSLFRYQSQCFFWSILRCPRGTIRLPVGLRGNFGFSVIVGDWNPFTTRNLVESCHLSQKTNFTRLKI